MKREFLLNCKVGEQSLPKELIDAIMAENGRDIEAAKATAVKSYEDYEAVKAENQRLQAEATVDGKTARQWKDALDEAVCHHKAQLDTLEFRQILDNAIYAAGGRNGKAIAALLELETLQRSENRQMAVQTALEELKQKESYLFCQQTPPPYARGTGARDRAEETAPTGLAGALREKFERK